MAVRLWKSAGVLELQIMAVEIERAVARPGQLDHIDPFLRVVVARIMFALLDAEHVELSFVPADHNIDANAAFADVIGGDEFLGGDQAEGAALQLALAVFVANRSELFWFCIVGMS